MKNIQQSLLIQESRLSSLVSGFSDIRSDLTGETEATCVDDPDVDSSVLATISRIEAYISDLGRLRGIIQEVVTGEISDDVAVKTTDVRDDWKV